MKVPTILIVGVLFAVVASASQAAVYGGGNQPAQTMSQAHRAIVLRSEALNRKYHLGAYVVAPKLDPAMRAVILRSEAHAPATAPATGSASGGEFAWDAAAVGGVLLVLLIGATALVRRPGTRLKTSG